MEARALNACPVISCNQVSVFLFRTANIQMEYMIGAIKLVTMIASLMDMEGLKN